MDEAGTDCSADSFFNGGHVEGGELERRGGSMRENMKKKLRDALCTYLETLRTHFADSERAPDWGFGALDYAFGAGIVTAKEYESMK